MLRRITGMNVTKTFLSGTGSTPPAADLAQTSTPIHVFEGHLPTANGRVDEGNRL
jgi:hypothetical protein